MDDVINLERLAELSGISTREILDHVRNGRLQAYRNPSSKRLLFMKTDVLAANLPLQELHTQVDQHESPKSNPEEVDNSMPPPLPAPTRTSNRDSDSRRTHNRKHHTSTPQTKPDTSIFNTGKYPHDQREATSHPSGPYVRPAAWGSPPTPLLPRWHLESLAAIKLPGQFVTRISRSTRSASIQVVGDLAHIWQFRSEPIPRGTLSVLSQLVLQHSDPPWDYVVIPATADLSRLSNCPFRTRASNCLRRAVSNGSLKQNRAVTVGELLSLESLGRGTLLEIMCVTEAAVDSGFLTAIEGTVDIRMRPPIDTIPQSETAVVSPPQSVEPVKRPDNWDNAISLFERLLGVTAELYRANTLADVLESDLGTLVSDLGLRSAFDHIEVDDLQSEPTMAHAALRSIDEFWRFLSPREGLIFKHRLATSKPLTLENLGTRLDVTRERVRQLQKLIESKWNHPSTKGPNAQWWLCALAIVIRDREGPITTRENLGQRLSAQFTSAVEVVGANTEIPEMACHLLNKALGYTCMNGTCLDQEAREIIQNLKTTAESIADDVGLVNEIELKDHLPAESWRENWETLVNQAGLHRLNGHLATRDTKKARLKAALISIGRPATKAELGELAQINPSRVGSHMSVVPGVVRADKIRWGLDEWVEDEYEGIPAEIIQRIEEDGGATRLKRLIEELPRLFGVSESSVRSYVATPRFLSRDGYVSLADKSTINLRQLHDAVHGHTPGGRPYWRFKVEARYFDGYSLTGIPPEIVRVLGCGPDGRTKVPVSSPAGCSPVSVGWPLSSIAGAYVGYLSEPLRKLEASAGDYILLVIDAGGSVSMHLDLSDNENQRTRDTEQSGSRDRGREILQRMKNRRRGL